MLCLTLTSGSDKAPHMLYEACIEKIADGDKEALGTLYERTKDAVYGFALSIVQNAHEAEDVLQDTYVSIYSSAGSYRKMGKPMAWILTIARNLSLMKVRAGRKTAALSEDEWSRFIAKAASVTSEDKLALTAALKTITPEESQIVMLHTVAGFKHRETAALLDLPLSTVLSRYNRAIKKLKAVLKEAGVHAE